MEQTGRALWKVVGLNLEGWEDFQSKGGREKSRAAAESNSYEQSTGL